jgi:hypothetical protein
MVVFCIVDMQSDPNLGFKTLTYNPKLIKKISNLTGEHVQKGSIVVLLEYKNFGSTDCDILNKLNKYAKCHKITKNRDDGSKYITKLLKEKGYSSIETEKIYICGINTHYCVKSTALGLAKRLPESQVIVLENYCKDINKKHTLGEVLAYERQINVGPGPPKNIRTLKRKRLNM